jgi:catechol 2,3-dioxygenase-like lactoylglutathione lyase family enzyme
MPLQRLEHYLVLSDDIHKTRAFYRDVLGMAIEINFRN